MDFPGSVQNFIYLLSKLGQQNKMFSEKAIEYFWSSLLLKKLSQNVQFSGVFWRFVFFGKSGKERADLMESAISELIVEHPEFAFMDFKGELGGAFKEDSPLFYRTCAYADGMIDGLSIRDIDLLIGPFYTGMFSFAIDSNLLYSDMIVPMEILDMMVDLLEIEPGMTVYDPAFGYGRAFYTIFRREGFDYTSFAGLEIDPRKWRLTKIILFLVGIDVSKLVRGDSLVKPTKETLYGEEQYDRVIIEPPTGERMVLQELKTDFFLRNILNISSGLISQWDFINHGMRSMKDDGKLVTLITRGELREGNMEVIDNDWLEAVVQLPLGAVHGGNDDCCLLVLNKAKPVGRKGQVFMSVSRSSGREPFCFEVREENLLLSSVMRNFRDWKGESGVCALIQIDTIKNSGYSLVPGDYSIIPVKKDQLPEDYEIFLTSPTVELDSIGEFLESHRYLRKSKNADLPEGHGPDEKEHKGKIYKYPRLKVNEKGIVQLVSLKEHAGELTKAAEKSLLRKNDIIFNRRDDITTMGLVTDIPSDASILPSGNHIVFRVSGEYDPVKVFNILRSDYGQFLIREATKHLFMEFLPLRIIQALRLPVEAIRAQRSDESGSPNKEVLKGEGSDSDV